MSAAKPDSPYRTAFLDWLACAFGGARERAARAARDAADGLLGEVCFAATAGHVLDFDDTYAEGVAHVSATCAPAALVLAAHLGTPVGAALEAYAEGFEAMAALAAASHPALYDRGWHPTAVCGPVGAAVAAASLLGLDGPLRSQAVAIGLLRAGGTRGAFGSDAKAIQVGMAAAAGVQGALLARAGATVDPDAIRGRLGFGGVLGGTWAEPRPAGAANGARAIERNWIKLYPSCLGTHAPIEAAALASERGLRLDGEPIEVHVDPIARKAAHIDLPADGLGAKFSIQYCVALTLARGRPRVRDFDALDGSVLDLSRRVEVRVDESLPEFGAALAGFGGDPVRVPCPPGAPGRPLTAAELERKVSDLAGERLHGVLDDVGAPAVEALRAAGLGARGSAAADTVHA